MLSNVLLLRIGRAYRCHTPGRAYTGHNSCYLRICVPRLKNLTFLIAYSVIAYLVVRFFIQLEYIILICPLYIEFCVHYFNCVPRETLGGSGGVVGEGLQVCVSGITRTLKVCHLEAIWENCSRHP